MAEFIHYSKIKGPKLFKFGKYSFSLIEIRHLLIALVLITLAIMALNKSDVFSIGILNFIIIYFFTIGLGFLLHELGHKFVAQYFGYVSEFRADFPMMIVSIIIAWFGFLFLAPGAVIIYGRPSVKENGIISVAGPIVNLILAIIFILIKLLIHPTGLFAYLVSLGILINAFLGLFNMLPFWILDGKKVLMWNKKIYFFVIFLFILIYYFNLN